MSAAEHKTPSPPAPSKLPSPGSLPKLPQTIFILENKGSSNGNGRPSRRK